MISFDVIDLETGEYPDLEGIALMEDWASDLMYCDMQGFYIGEGGRLLLADECGRYEHCPRGRFKIIVKIKGVETDYSFVY